MSTNSSGAYSNFYSSPALRPATPAQSGSTDSSASALSATSAAVAGAAATSVFDSGLSRAYMNGAEACQALKNTQVLHTDDQKIALLDAMEIKIEDVKSNPKSDRKLTNPFWNRKYQEFLVRFSPSGDSEYRQLTNFILGIAGNNQDFLMEVFNRIYAIKIEDGVTYGTPAGLIDILTRTLSENILKDAVTFLINHGHYDYIDFWTISPDYDSPWDLICKTIVDYKTELKATKSSSASAPSASTTAAAAAAVACPIIDSLSALSVQSP